jgi:1-acyl-sn-glycerol-3-phosphate acyltransferase
MIRTLLSPFRTVFAVPFTVVATWLTCWALTFLSWRDSTTAWIERVLDWWSKSLLFAAGVSLSIEGLENIEAERSYVIVSNHQSALDIPAQFLAFPVPVRFLAKKELYRIPILGTALRAIGCVEVDRQAGAAVHRQINTQSTEVMRRGHSILVYAEGTRFRDGTVHAFKRGAFSIAIDAGMPILPVAVVGGAKAWPQRRPLLGGPMKVAIAQPIETSELSRKDVSALRDQTRREIEEMSSRLG